MVVQKLGRPSTTSPNLNTKIPNGLYIHGQKQNRLAEKKGHKNQEFSIE